MSILVIAENDNVSLKASTLNTITAAKAISPDIDVLVCGQGCEMPAKAAAEVAGVRKVYCADCEQLAHRLPEAMAEAVRAALQKDAYTHVFFTSSTAGKAAMPRLAGLLGVSALTDVCGVKSADTFKRYIYAGGVLATVKTLANPVIATIRPTAFEAAPAEGGSAGIEALTVDFKSRGFAFVSEETQLSDKPDLLTARRVVAGGRGLIDEEGFAALEAFADKIGAAVGSTRAVVDMGLAPNESQVGQTGKIVAPELYFAFGISGAIQHVAGMKDSKVIVAVNKDNEAAMFDYADYYLEADAVEVIKELTSKL